MTWYSVKSVSYVHNLGAQMCERSVKNIGTNMSILHIMIGKD